MAKFVVAGPGTARFTCAVGARAVSPTLVGVGQRSEMPCVSDGALLADVMAVGVGDCSTI